MTRLWSAVLILALALLRVATSGFFDPRAHGHAAAHEPREHTTHEYVPAPYSVGARAMLGDLAPGDELAGWRVRWVEGDVDTEIRIRLRQGDVAFTVSLVPTGSRPHSPAYRTARHDLFYGHTHPPEASLPDYDVDRILSELVARVAASGPP